MKPIILRCDDFDPRLELKYLKPLHEEHLKRNIPFTVAVNNCMGHRIGFDQDVIRYVNEETPAESWDIQLHGWEHERYWTMKWPHVYRDMKANIEWTKETFVRSDPKVFYPPWNETSGFLQQACDELGLTMVASNHTIRELMWNGREDKDCFFWHWWTQDDREILPQALDRLVELNKQRGFEYKPFEK